jgi:hypothetical protein
MEHPHVQLVAVEAVIGSVLWPAEDADNFRLALDRANCIAEGFQIVPPPRGRAKHNHDEVGAFLSEDLDGHPTVTKD